MASVHKHIRSGTASKRPTTAIAEGQIALATNIASPGLFFKDSTGATIVKIGPVHVGATAPNVSPAGSAGNSIGEVWLDTSLTPIGVKIYNGTAFVNATPIGSTTVQGLLELATDAETQAGADTARAVTSASLQSKLSDSTSTTSNITIASSTAVKAAYDLANAALPKTGGTVTGNLEIGTAGSLTFEGATADGFETTIAVVDPTADRTITLPNTTGTVVTTGDTGTVTSTMLLDGTILNADVNASAAIAGSKLSPDFGAQTIGTTGVHSAALGAAATPSITFTGDLNTGIFSPGADQLAVATNGTEKLIVLSNGNVGIGTSSPSGQLEVFRTSTTDPALRLRYSSTSYYGDHLMDGNGNYVIYSPAANGVTSGNLRLRAGSSFSISTNDQAVTSPALTIDTSGRVGIGTTSPSALLDVALVRSSATHNTACFGTTGTGVVSDISRILIKNVNTAGGQNFGVGIGGVLTVNGSNQAALAFYYDSGSATTEAARIDTSGRLLVGTVTGNANGGILQLTSGITFPATAVAASDANTLDDYEEGAWTPVATSQTGSITAYTSSATYTKTGNVVCVLGTIGITTAGTAAGVLLIAGYPFTASSQGSLALAAETNLTAVAYQVRITASTTTGFIAALAGSGAIYTNGGSYSFALTYLT